MATSALQESDPTAAAAAAPSHWALPVPPGNALPLVAADYAAAAKQLGVEPASIHAVATVESGGRTGFDSKKRPIIRYENHHFRSLTKRQFDKTHPDLSAPYNGSQYKATHRFGGDKYADEQWDLLTRAFVLSPDAAVMACSWGMFQVMGENYKDGGWTSLEQFVKDMFDAAAQHLRAFLGYCKTNGLVPYLAKHQWASFAQGYNGPAYRDNHYDTSLATYYKQYSRAGA